MRGRDANNKRKRWKRERKYGERNTDRKIIIKRDRGMGEMHKYHLYIYGTILTRPMILNFRG